MKCNVCEQEFTIPKQIIVPFHLIDKNTGIIKEFCPYCNSRVYEEEESIEIE